MEEERLDLLRLVLAKLFSLEESCNQARARSAETCIKAVQMISKEEEVRIAVDSIKSRKVEEDDFEFSRLPTNYEQVVDRFNEYCDKHASHAEFDLDSARTIYYQMEGEIDEQDKVTLKELSDILTLSWNGEENDLGSFKEIVKLQKVRKLFSNVLSQYKRGGIFLMKRKGCEMVLKLLYILMEQIEKDDDVGNAISTLLLAQLLYVETEEGKRRVFIQQKAKESAFWKNKVLWGRTIEAAMNDETREKDKKTKEAFEAQRKFEMLEKLTEFIESMLQFDINVEDIKEVILHYAAKSKLPEEYKKLLIVSPS
eukprot:TRINITY_DN4296_c0_g1_i14.p1 TRINITY_DN4296_c0_g1~~TRINITY_DN4296_c0_g1_i14.p1  ORF type:complete len:312 (-),score=89.71 TRINITY_DN4296_c0_g1_i14:265-1200(-)